MPIFKGASFWIRSWERVTTVVSEAAFPEGFSPNPAALGAAFMLCSPVCEAFFNNYPDVSVVSKFSINFGEPSFPACCFSSFRAQLFKCCFSNKFLLFIFWLLQMCSRIALGSDAVFGADTSSHLFVLLVKKTPLDSISVLLILCLDLFIPINLDVLWEKEK